MFYLAHKITVKPVQPEFIRTAIFLRRPKYGSDLTYPFGDMIYINQKTDLKNPVNNVWENHESQPVLANTRWEFMYNKWVNDAWRGCNTHKPTCK